MFWFSTSEDRRERLPTTCYGYKTGGSWVWVVIRVIEGEKGRLLSIQKIHFADAAYGLLPETV